MAIAEIVVPDIARLKDLETVKFSYGKGRPKREGFIVRYRGRLYAYRNECRHIPMSMDWVENRFLSRDGRHLQCASHGALYELDSGLCVWGPPEGQSLHALEMELRGKDAVVKIPE